MKFIIFIGCFIAVAVSDLQNLKKDTQICLDPQCVIAAANLIQHINPQVDPCDNFHDFVCGQYLKNNFIPGGESQLDGFVTLALKVKQELQNHLETLLKTDQTGPLDLLKQLYEECMDTTKIDELSIADFKSILQSLGDWPVVVGEEWNENTADWKKITYLLRKIGYDTNSLMSLYAGVDPKNSTRYILIVDEPELTIITELLLNGTSNKVVKAYYEFMVEVAVSLGADRNVAENELKKSLEFEIELAKIVYPTDIKYQPHYNNMTVQDLITSYSFNNWKEYINNVVNIPGITVNSEDMVNVINPQYIKELGSLLSKTSNSTVSNYIIWRMVHYSLPYLSKQFKEKRVVFDSTQLGGRTAITRNSECENTASEKLPVSLGSLYVQNHFSNQTKEIVEKMITDIKSVYRSIMESSTWMDPVTKHRALEKLTALEPLVGYSDEAFNEQKLQDYYSGLQLNTQSYLRSILSIDLFFTNKNFKKLFKNANRLEWSNGMPYMTVNAMYEPDRNIIQIPAGILQGNFFNKDNPKYLNYGSIGYILGHEIGHGFDNKGRHYDKTGNLINWWTNETNSVFERNAECLIKQYDAYTITELNGTHANGKLTINENIADNGGIKTAYLGYQEWIKRNGEEQTLPGLNYTANQLFWMSSAITWCTKYKQASLENVILIDPHSVNRFRVIGPLSNSEYFARDFNCPKGSKMNPEHKCHIW